MSAQTEGPLAGLLVVSVEQAVAAPFATSRLADAGARVIKVERAEGDFARLYDHVVDGECAWFVWLNRGKESVVLDIKDAGDNALLHRIIARADVFVQNLAPGAAARAGFDSSELRERHPRLITCDISGYGESGPYARMKAYDFLIQCESGIASVTGSPESASRVGVSVCDIGAGLNAYGAILEALHGRHRTGRGGGIRVSLFDGMADWMTVPLLHLEHGGKAPARTGLNHAMIAPYGAYPGGRRRPDGDRDPERARVGALLRTHPGRRRAHDGPPLRRPPGPPREQARDGRADRRSFWPPRPWTRSRRHYERRGSPSAASTRSPASPRTPNSAAQPSRHPPARSRSWHPPPATTTRATARSAPSRPWARRARRSGGSLPMGPL